MPIYEYACKSCGHVFDALQKMSDDPLTDCPECDEPSLKKLLSAPNFRLKGGGWYETDFKSGNRRNIAEGSDGKGPADAGKKDDAAKADTSKKDSMTQPKPAKSSAAASGAKSPGAGAD